MITLTLLHPLQSVPVQSWTFEPDSVIRIGRSTDNEVILYSAVVSRHHVEIRRNVSGWEIVSLGANGTYIDGKRITQMPVEDGMIVRLASSGPKIQIHIEGESPKSKLKAALGKHLSSKTKGIDISRETFINSKATHAEEGH
ncbi:MAG TPA: phosphopeptide-binding protein [Cyanobacteria bacterium UBA8553]|nr:phosphopeptide-binding protein [Cyanobacteria bacterium UBA8553]